MHRFDYSKPGGGFTLWVNLPHDQEADALEVANGRVVKSNPHLDINAYSVKHHWVDRLDDIPKEVLIKEGHKLFEGKHYRKPEWVDLSGSCVEDRDLFIMKVESGDEHIFTFRDGVLRIADGLREKKAIDGR